MPPRLETGANAPTAIASIRSWMRGDNRPRPAQGPSPGSARRSTYTVGTSGSDPLVHRQQKPPPSFQGRSLPIRRPLLGRQVQTA